MSEATTEADVGLLALDLDEEPDEVSAEEYEKASFAILERVGQAADDLLYDLPAGTETILVRLAFHDPLGLDRLERKVKAAIRASEQKVPFSLKVYTQAARTLKAKIGDAARRHAKLRARNLKILEGSKGNDKLANIPADAPTQAQAWLYSESPILQAAGWLLSHYKGRIWRDTFHNNFFTDWDGRPGATAVPARPINDAWMLRAYVTVLDQNVPFAKFGRTVVEDAIRAVANEDERNEPQQWLEGLAWDGVERLPTWLSKVYGVPQDQYHSDVGRCWLVSIAARITTPGCKVDTMPVLQGPQGTAKSQALEVLGGKWYAAVNVSLDRPQDFLATLAGRVVAELPELDALQSNRVSKTRVKALLSTSTDIYRPPYGKVAEEFKRTAVLAGTTNEVGWHGDETGGRRFWPIECRGDIDLVWLREHREQLFAEAKERLARGEKWWDFDRREQERRMGDHLVEDALVDQLRQVLLSRRDLYLGPGRGVKPVGGDISAPTMEEHWGNVITTSWVSTVVLQAPVERQNSATAKRVAHAMTRLGFKTYPERVQFAGSVRMVRVWVATPEADAWMRGEEGERLL